MKKVILQFCFFAGLAAWLIEPLFAQGKIIFRSEIPFGFNIGQAAMPAGEYIIEKVNPSSNQQLLVIRSMESNKAKLVIVSPKAGHDKQDAPRLVFNRYGERYFLTGIHTPEGSAEFDAGESESEAGQEIIPAAKTLVLE